LADILNVQKDFFDSKNGKVKEDLRFQSPSDLFLRTTRHLLEVELRKESTASLKAENQIKIPNDFLIPELERAMGAIALEMATRGYWTQVQGGIDQVIAEVNKIREAARQRFILSRRHDFCPEKDSESLWGFAYEFLERFQFSGGGLQLEAGSSFLQFPTRKIQEMRIARYLTRYAADKDHEAIYLNESDAEYAEAVKPEQSSDRRRGASQHHSSAAWEEVWRNVIRMPLVKGERPGLEKERYKRVLRWLYQPAHAGERRPTRLMTEAWVQAKKLGKQDSKWQHFADELVSGLKEQFQQILDGEHGEDKQTVAQSLIDPDTYQILGQESGSGLDGDTGRFRMGDDEKDKKEVTLSRFGMQKLLISNTQFQLFDDSYLGRKEDRDRFGNDDQPAVYVSWYDAWWFSRFVGEVVVKGQTYQVTLPTEAQWEYSARAGSNGEFFRAARGTKKIIEVTEDLLPEYAHYRSNRDSPELTLPVTSKQPNLWGLRMTGNAWQWTLDGWQLSILGGPDPLVTGGMASLRVYRGGSWSNGAAICRSAYRFGHDPSYRNGHYGFRVALSPCGIPRAAELQSGIKID
jgi:formylglycine-generating enzyme required for sulfatase activity